MGDSDRTKRLTLSSGDHHALHVAAWAFLWIGSTWFAVGLGELVLQAVMQSADGGAVMIPLSVAAVLVAAARRPLPVAVRASARGVAFGSGDAAVPWSALRAIEHRPAMANWPGEIDIVVAVPSGKIVVHLVPIGWMKRAVETERLDPSAAIERALGGRPNDHPAGETELARFQLWIYQRRVVHAVLGAMLAGGTAVTISGLMHVGLAPIALGVLASSAILGRVLYVARRTGTAIAQGWIDARGVRRRVGSGVPKPRRFLSFVFGAALPNGSELVRVDTSDPDHEAHQAVGYRAAPAAPASAHRWMLQKHSSL